MKVLFCPCHYIFDELSIGSDLSWAYYIPDKLSKYLNKTTVVTGFSKLKNRKKYNVIELQPHKETLDYSIRNALEYNFKYFIETLRLKGRGYDIIHHVLPFGICSTYNLYALLKISEIPRLIVGPIQAGLEFIHEDIIDSDFLGFSPKKRNMYFNDLLFKISSPFLSKLNLITLKKADKIIVINEYARDLLIKRGVDRDKLVIISPGIDKKLFSRKNYIDKKNIEIISVSFLNKRKSVDLAILAFNEVLKKYQNVIFRIVGDGPQLENLKYLVRELGISDHVIFEGFVNHKDTPKYYKNADIFISMSKAESWGQMYLEAMSCGIPVICTGNRGSRQIVKDNITGFLIDQGDYIAMADRIIFLIKNKNLMRKFGRNGRKEIEEKYDWDDVIIKKYLDVYNEIA